MKVLLSPILTSRFKDERAKKVYYIPDDVRRTGFNGAILPPDVEPFKYLFVVLINGLELPTLYVYTGTGFVDTGINTESTAIAINYSDPDNNARLAVLYRGDLVVPDIPLGDKVPCNVVTPSNTRCILDIQISSLKKNDTTDGYDIINKTVSLVQGNSYTFVYSDTGVRGRVKIIKGRIESINTSHNYDINSKCDVHIIEVDTSKNYESRKVLIKDIYLYDVQDIDHEYDEDEFAKEEISPDPKYWIDITDPVVETIVPGGEQPRE